MKDIKQIAADCGLNDPETVKVLDVCIENSNAGPIPVIIAALYRRIEALEGLVSGPDTPGQGKGHSGHSGEIQGLLGALQQCYDATDYNGQSFTLALEALNKVRTIARDGIHAYHQDSKEAMA